MDTLAKRLKALSDPTRLRIVRLLDGGELCVCDLMAGLALPQSKVSRHMSYLEHSGWARGARKGKWVYYTLAEPDDAVRSGVLRVLRETLPLLPEGREDDMRLRGYLESKTPAACG